MRQVINRTSERSKVKNTINFRTYFDRFTNIFQDELKAGATFEVRDICSITRDEIVERKNLVPRFDEPVAEV